jgi:asparagine synthase (glutamine-hydrolysing)
MSAICGIFFVDGKLLDGALLERQLRSLDHRGIDGSGSWHLGSVGFGHQMLHITPESLTETLPLYQAAPRLAITADVRLDNREQLFTHLSVEKHTQKGMPDSQLLLMAYERWGRHCPEYLLGDFAFAIWDAARQELFCATDPMGLRPLFYYWRPGLFVFASEIRAIHILPTIQRSPDLRKIASLSMPGLIYLDGESTFFEGVRCLSASSTLTVNGAGLSHRQYWEPDASRRLDISTEDDCVEAFQDLFHLSVGARLRSAYPVASMYSGGLDSSAITGVAADLLAGRGQRLTALSAVLPPNYSGPFCDERDYIDSLKIKANLDIDYISAPERGPFDNLTQLIASAEMPTCPSSHYLNTAMAEAAGRRKARVILNGLGGEASATFNGAGVMAEWLMGGEYGLVLKEMWARSKQQQSSWASVIKGELIMPLLPDWLVSRWMPRFDLAQFQRSSVIRNDFVKRQLGGYTNATVNVKAYGRTSADHRVNQINLINYYRNYGRNLLNFGAHVDHEKTSLWTPFFDKRIIEFCLALPGHMKVHDGYKRYMIRSGMRGLLPDKLRWRTSKQPYSPDFHERYNRQLQQVRHTVTNFRRTALIDEIIDMKRLVGLLDYQMLGNRGNTPEEFAAMHTVPRALYLLFFLDTFE